ncbi:MAG: TonB-dependent receptor [Alphaproteobacteria bacterium]|nr:TonB-dependent receptor [Alphaproteobacteria bacterium]
MSKTRFLGSSALWLIAGALPAAALILPSGAFAQGADEIVVQARKRAESLQNIPVSGSVLGQQAIEDFGGIIDPVQLGEYLTAVQVDEEGNAEYFIRGAGSGRNPLADSATSQLRNGSNTAGAFGGRAFQNIDQFDTKQIEVYRGAQGALYGRSAVGGVINVVNQEPKDIFEYSGLLSYDFERNQSRAEAIVNYPLVENRLFFRGGIQLNDDKGLYENKVPLFGIDEDHARQFQRSGGRAGLRWLINESMDATLFIDYEYTNSPSLLNDRQAVHRDDFISSGTGSVDPDGNPLPNNTAIKFPYPDGDMYSQHQDTPGSFDQGLLNAFLQVNADLGFATFASITNVRNQTYDFLLDADGTYVGAPRLAGAFCAGTMLQAGTVTQMCVSKTNSESFIATQEFRLVSATDGPLNWLAGVDFRFVQNPIIDDLFGFREVPVMAGPVYTFINRRHDIDQENKEFGIFGSLGYDISSALQLGASVRYTYIDKEYQQLTTSNDLVNILAGAPPAIDRDVGLVFQNLSPSVHLTYKFDSGLLAYVSWAQAFRPGGFNRTFGTSTAATGSETVLPQFDQELANSYEIGFKDDFLLDFGSFRYSASIFRVEYNGVLQNAGGVANDQASDPDADDSTFVSQANNLLNVGDAYVHGAEVDLGGTVRDLLGTGGRLVWQGGLSFSESKIHKLSSLSRASRIDDHLAELPLWTWNGNFTYRRPLPFFENSGLGFFANTNFSYEVGRHQQAQQKRGNTQRWNARLGIEGENLGTSWQAVAFFNNVFDVEYERARLTCANSAGSRCYRANERATWGLRLSFKRD